jgi:hypothetical protein
MNSGGATTGGSVNIANGTLQTTTVNIASGTGTGAVTIGNSANATNINGGIINLAQPPTFTYTTLLPLSTFQIGHTLRSILPIHTNITSGIFTNPFTALTLAQGVWSVYYQIRLKATSSTTSITSTSCSCSLATPQSSMNNYAFNWFQNSFSIGINGEFAYCGSSIIRNTTDSNVLTPSVMVTYTPADSCQFYAIDTYFNITRIT